MALLDQSQHFDLVLSAQLKGEICLHEIAARTVSSNFFF